MHRPKDYFKKAIGIELIRELQHAACAIQLLDGRVNAPMLRQYYLRCVLLLRLPTFLRMEWGNAMNFISAATESTVSLTPAGLNLSLKTS